MVKMPGETINAVNWALDNDVELEYKNGLVDKVREYFNGNQIECEPMSYDDLVPYLPFKLPQ